MSSPTGEWCRRCLEDEHGRKLVPADGIVWGKLNPPDALGPRCLACIGEQCGWHAEQSVRARDGQWAIYPLRVLFTTQDRPPLILSEDAS